LWYEIICDEIWSCTFKLEHIDSVHLVLVGLFSFWARYENFPVFANKGFCFADFKHALVLEPTNKRAAAAAERLRKVFQ